MSLHFVAQMSVERLMNGLGEGVLVALFAWVLLRLIGRRNAGTRFAVWFSALVAIACAPFLETSSGSRLVHPAAAIVMPREWSWYLFAGWAVIALAGMARVLAGLRHLRRIRKSCMPIESDRLDPVIVQAMKEFRSVRGAELCASEAVQVPTAIGFLRPAVVLPAWALSELSAAELHALILHELAHLRRWDDWTNLAQKVLRALFFFHPAVWWVENRLSLEREMACDDLVLAHTSDPRAYAECLVSLAEKSFVRRGLALAQAAVGRMRQTSLRVLQILDARRPGGAGIWKPAPWVVAVFSVACLSVAAHAPKLVAFGDGATAPAVQTSAVANLRADDSSYAAPVVRASYVGSGVVNNHGRDQVKNRGAVRPTASAKPALLKSKSVSGSRTSTSAVHQATSGERQRMPATQLVRASLTESAPQFVVQETFFVVTTESQRVGEQVGDFSSISIPLYLSGEQSTPVVWHVRIWHFTVLPSAPTSQKGAPSKSI